MGSASVAPIDQNVSGPFNNAKLVASRPTSPLSVRFGKNAARATPISELAAAISRSALDTSGRRSSRAAGTPVGMSRFASGIASWGGSAKEDAGTPISTAIAFSASARCASVSVVSASAPLSSLRARSTSIRLPILCDRRSEVMDRPVW